MRAGILIYHPKLNSILTIYRYKMDNTTMSFQVGKLRRGESPIEAAIREIKEEVQLFLSLRRPKTAFTYDSDDNQHIWFLDNHTGLGKLNDRWWGKRKRSHSQNLHEARWISSFWLSLISPFRPKDLQAEFFNKIWNRSIFIVKCE